jgi:hypothetical protein
MSNRLLLEETVMTDASSAALEQYLSQEKKSADIISTSALSGTALCVAGGAVLITIALSFGLMPRAFGAGPMPWQVAVVLGIAGLALLWWAIWRRGLPVQLGALEVIADHKPEPERSTELYGIYLVGVGFALLVQALACSMVFAAIAWSMGHLPAGEHIQVPPALQNSGAASGLANLFGRDADDSFVILGLLNLSTLVATLGAMFFFANSLYMKMKLPERETFDRRLFWGGLWFRIAEALLFNLVFFLVLRYYAPDRYLLLLLVSLMVGLFLKAGESLVSGVATRVIASIQALVPNELSSQRVMRVFAFELSGFEENLSPESKKEVVDALVESIKDIPGVEEVEGDSRVIPSVRVEYNAAAVKRADIGRKVELKGLQIKHP